MCSFPQPNAVEEPNENSQLDLNGLPPPAGVRNANPVSFVPPTDDLYSWEKTAPVGYETGLGSAGRLGGADGLGSPGRLGGADGLGSPEEVSRRDNSGQKEQLYPLSRFPMPSALEGSRISQTYPPSFTTPDRAQDTAYPIIFTTPASQDGARRVQDAIYAPNPPTMIVPFAGCPESGGHSGSSYPMPFPMPAAPASGAVLPSMLSNPLGGFPASPRSIKPHADVIINEGDTQRGNDSGGCCCDSCCDCCNDNDDTQNDDSADFPDA